MNSKNKYYYNYIVDDIKGIQLIERKDNIINIRIKNLRVQIILPWVFLNEQRITVDLDTVITIQYKKPNFKKYFSVGVILLGLGVCVEYHLLSKGQIELQAKLLKCKWGEPV